ncbi:hypothetical protein ACFUAG_34925 [Streptomyces sp. NPDC057193]|uniref:hypothetical protein n=1 Tax=unclassified Streptomyces TaxID=2593676 RepID=UPI0036344CE5
MATLDIVPWVPRGRVAGYISDPKKRKAIEEYAEAFASSTTKPRAGRSKAGQALRPSLHP